MNRRDGVTLVEVLIAMFLATVGLLSLLTLFPAGMQNMAQAIQDNRSAHVKQNARALAETLQIHKDPGVDAAFHQPSLTGTQAQVPKTASGFRSHAVLVDSVGFIGQLGQSREWVAGGYLDAQGQRVGVPRRPILSLGTNSQRVRESTTFLDDVHFVNDADVAAAGTPAGGGNVERGGEYSWGYLLHKPDASKSPVSLHVVVYRKRSVQLTPALSLANEQAFDALLSPLDKGFTIQGVGVGQNPPVSPGQWVQDVTVDTSISPPLTYGHFYKVVSVYPLTGDELFVEVETPIFESKVHGNGQRLGKIVLHDSVIDVFDMGLLD